MLSSRFAGIPISSSTIDGPGVPQLLNRGEQTMRAMTGSGGRLHFGMVAGIKSERWPTSNRNPWPDCLGIRIVHEVLVVPADSAWQGTTYASLSTIAKTITGTGWNGPRFFGLRPRKMPDQQADPTGEWASLDRDRKPQSSSSRKAPVRSGRRSSVQATLNERGEGP